MLSVFVLSADRKDQVGSRSGQEQLRSVYECTERTWNNADTETPPHCAFACNLHSTAQPRSESCPAGGTPGPSPRF